MIVKRHERVGRMADTLEYKDVAFPRARFVPKLVDELEREAPSLFEQDQVGIGPRSGGAYYDGVRVVGAAHGDHVAAVVFVFLLRGAFELEVLSCSGFAAGPTCHKATPMQPPRNHQPSAPSG